jgi:hypothetical protein
MRHLFAKLIQVVQSKKAGGTFDHAGNTVRYGRGYQVGLYGYELRFSELDPMTVFEICAWLDNVERGFFDGPYPEESRFSVGLWFDTSTSEYCLDLSLFVDDAEEAARFAHINKQKAIWDWTASGSVICC